MTQIAEKNMTEKNLLLRLLGVDFDFQRGYFNNIDSSTRKGGRRGGRGGVYGVLKSCL